MDWEDYKTSVRQLDALIAERRLDAALAHVDRLLASSPGSVALLIKQATLRQLQNDDAQTPTLADCRQSLERAIELEPNAVEPYVELGHLDYAVADDPQTALISFEKAVESAAKGLKEGLIGMAKCQLELGQLDAVQKIIEYLKLLFPDDLDVAMLEDECEQ
ncbi:MAG: hypothetical protein AAGC55_12030 [Myxococcota bacterium]